VRVRIYSTALLVGLMVAATVAAAALPHEEPARGKFLIASPEMRDPNFSETVVLLLEYDDTGALGLIINWPTEVAAAHLLPKVEGLAEDSPRVFIGGPVRKSQITLLVESDEAPEQARHIFENIYFSGSGDLLAQLAAQESAEQRFRLYAGCAGWGAGQLEAELARGGWRVLPGEASIVFDPSPEGVWDELIKKSTVHWTEFTRSNPGRLGITTNLDALSP
jgi:putative transcriptional regulator